MDAKNASLDGFEMTKKWMVRQITKWFYKCEMMNVDDYMIKFFCRVGKKDLFAHRIGLMLKVGVQRNHLYTLRLLWLV